MMKFRAYIGFHDGMTRRSDEYEFTATSVNKARTHLEEKAKASGWSIRRLERIILIPVSANVPLP